MTTCPSGVNYMHLVDHARPISTSTYRPPLAERLPRSSGLVLPRRASSAVPAPGPLARPFAGLLAGSAEAPGRCSPWPRALPAPARPSAPTPPRPAGTRRHAAGLRRARAQARDPRRVVRLLGRHGVEVVVAKGERLLRGARSPHGARPTAPTPGAAQCRRLDARDRGGRARRHRHHRVGLRHDGQGLRLHAA
jgi:hypothetical protein